MESSASRIIETSRFSRLLNAQVCERPAFDVVLAEESGCVVAPTLGSIVPDWLLIVPRVWSLNFAEWRLDNPIEPVELVRRVAKRMGCDAGKVIWFEHGPALAGSPVGCGLDHAHLHVLLDPPFNFDALASTATRNSYCEWKRVRTADVYPGISAGSSYLLAAEGAEAILAGGVEAAGSQFFRKLIASMVGAPEAWNYREHQFIENVNRTLGRFSGAVKKAA
jgi:ATP adenylyltransferase